MIKIDKIKRIQELVKQLNTYRDEYYNQNDPSVTDSVYDKEFDELKVLETETNFILSNSPTQTVGYKIVSDLPKVQHTIPLLSLDKTKSVDDIKRFIGNKPSLLMLKYDGLTIELIYNNGELIQGSTRGDAYYGEDITNNVHMFKNVPSTINYKKYLKITGEAIIHKNDFETINNNLTDDEKKKLKGGKYANTRALVSGSVKLLNNEICAKRNVYFYPWDVLEGFEDVIKWDNRFDKLRGLKQCGFENPTLFTISGDKDLDQLEEMVESLKKTAEEKYIPIDGLVAKYNNVKYSKSLGSTSHHNNDGYALKFKDETAETTLRNIEWSMGRTGCLTPVAIFDTVELDGTEVSRASLHNVSIIENLELGLGDEISIAKMNMIIPQIVENHTRSNFMLIPDSCPVCGGKTEIIITESIVNGEKKIVKTLVCTNPNCSGKLLGRFTHFVGKSGMNIDGLSEATLDTFINNGWIEEFADIYKLDKYKDEIVKTEGFGKKSYDNLWSAIQNSRDVTLDHFIVALGILNLGKTASKQIAEECGYDINNLFDKLNHNFNWCQLNNFGVSMSESLTTYFKLNMNEIIFLSKLMNFKVNSNNNMPNNLKGKTFAITGSLQSFKNRDELKNLIEKFGGTVSDSINKNTNILINNDIASNSNKNIKAKALNISIINEEMFIQMLES